MKKLIAVVIALVFALTVSVAFAQQPAAKPAEPAKKAEPAKPAEPAKKAEGEKKPAKEKVKSITGEVTAVDTVGKTITVKSKKQELTIGVTDEQVKDIKAGDKVVVKYTEKDGKLTAKSVKKVAAKAKKAEKKAEKKEEKKQ